MDAVIKPWPKSSAADDLTLSDHVRAAPAPVVPKPSREQALAAVRTLIAYAGDNPDREGGNPEAARHRGDDRGRAHVHVPPGGGKTGLLHDYHPVYRQLPRQPRRSGPLYYDGARR